MTGSRGSTAVKFRLRPDVVIEDFESKSLVLLTDSMQLREINGEARRLLLLVDGVRTVLGLSEAFICETDGALEDVIRFVADSLFEMERLGILARSGVPAEVGSGRLNTVAITAHPDVVFWQFGDNEGVLLMPQTGRFTTINATAMEVWKILAAPVSVPDIVNQVAVLYPDVMPGEIASDVTEFLEFLIEQQFVCEMRELG